MAIEGLKVILEKEAVVPTPTADRLIAAPATVDGAFLHHVRSYVPFGRAAGTGEEDGLSIADYEQRLIEKVRSSAAPKGYITADFGYGKTSTALYIWDRCRAANLLTIPPFQLGRLDDLIHATYGWARYEIGRTAPGLVSDLDALYKGYSERSIESDAGGDAALAEKLRGLLEAGRYNLTLVATDYVTFFERLVELAKRAGFVGLVLLPDEVQQYLDPAIRSGYGDPIAPLHNVVEALNTRRGHLPVGLIFVLPRKELGVINNDRGDLVQRLKMDGLGLDLGAVYDKRFAGRLWERLAQEFDFTDVAGRITTVDALDALGQIAARDDLANGPRTVIGAFSWMTRRYLNADSSVPPVTPIDLVDAFLSGEIVFDGSSKLQAVIQTHLETPLVAERLEFRRAVKVFAAFPTDGAMESVLRDLDLQSAAEELDRLARGDVTIMVGGGLDDRGERVPYGFTLRGLEPRSAVAQDWMFETLREFSRGFAEGAERTIERAEAGFARLLADVVFRQPHWKRIEVAERRKTDGANHAVVFEGSFPATSKRFPERRVLVRLLREGELPDQDREDVDVTLDVTLALRLDPDHRHRRTLAGELTRVAEGRARLALNLFHREHDDYYPELQETLQDVVSPNLVTPLLMLALHEYLEEKRRAHQIPKQDDRQVEQFYQPRLLEHSAEELFNAELGAPFNARGPRVIEELFRILVEARYPTYRTLIRQQGWAQALKTYELALERLESRHERQGTAVEASRDEIAKLFNKSSTAVASFIDAFTDLIEVEPAFKGRERSAVRFALHPFEEYVQRLLLAGETVTVQVNGRAVPVKRIELGLVRRSGAAQGYREREIGALLDLMAKRELVEVSLQRGLIQEVAHVQLTAEDLARKVAAVWERMNGLLTAFPDDATLSTHLGHIKQMQKELTSDKKLDEATIRRRDAALRAIDQQLAAFLEAKLTALRASAKDVALDGLVDPRQTHRLADPISGGFFAPQLDANRRKLLDEAEAFRARRDDLKRRTLDVVGRLNAETATDEGVIRFQAEVSELRRDAHRLTAAAKALDERGQRLATARRVLVQADELAAKLALEGGTVDDPDLVASFRALTERIQGELSSRKEAALDGAERWETEFGELRNRLNAMLNAVRGIFEARKGRYQALLRTYAHVPPDSDPLLVTFNPLDPSSSLRALTDAVSQVLVAAFDKMAMLLDTWQADLRQLLASGDLAYADDPLAIEAECQALIEAMTFEVTSVRSEIVRARDLRAMGDVDVADGGPTIGVMQSVDVHAQSLRGLGMRHAAVQAAVKPRQLEPAERELLAAIERVAVEPGALLDVGAVLDPRSSMSTLDMLWPLIDGLYRKRRLRVRLEIIETGQL